MVWYPRENIEECLLWRGHPAKVYQDEIPFGTWFVDESPRAGGSYYWGDDQREGLRSFEKIDEHHKARITTWLVDQRRLGNTSPTITRAIIDATKTARSLTADERANRLLRFLAEETTAVGQSVALMYPGQREAWLSMAHSESTDLEEVRFLLSYLCEKQWVMESPYLPGIISFTVTLDGYGRIAEQEVNASSDQVFVAMWFGDGLERTGYDVYTENQNLFRL